MAEDGKVNHELAVLATATAHVTLVTCDVSKTMFYQLDSEMADSNAISSSTP